LTHSADPPSVVVTFLRLAELEVKAASGGETETDGDPGREIEQFPAIQTLHSILSISWASRLYASAESPVRAALAAMPVASSKAAAPLGGGIALLNPEP
jgi:hypothetical protein